MGNQVEIICKNNGKTLLVDEGTALIDIYKTAGVELPYQVLCAQVNNRTRDLSYRVYQPKQIMFSDASHIMGMRMYVRSLCFVLYKAVTELFPGTRLRIEHSVSNGYFCCLNQREEIPHDTVELLKERMREIIRRDLPFERIQSTAEVAAEHFREQDMCDKIDLIETLHPLYATYYKLGNLYDVYYEYLLPSTGYLKVFDLIKYHDGMLLIPPKRKNPNELSEVVPQDKMFNVFKDNLKISEIVGLNNVGDMNRAILKHTSGDLIKVTEALHEKQISRIADQITARHNSQKGGARIILISGPSSSGKTTFSKRLSIQLMTNLLIPITISLDNYFLDREHVWVQSCLFAGCLFPACVLRGSHFTDVTFRNCDLSNADLTGCSFQRVEFLDCKLMGTNLSEATMQHVAFERCKAEFANFALGRLRFVAHSQGVMRGAVFDECRLEKASFSRCDLTQGEFRGTRLRGLSFADSDIRGIRVGEVDSFELKGLKINALQAVDLVRLLGVEVEE